MRKQEASKKFRCFLEEAEKFKYCHATPLRAVCRDRRDVNRDQGYLCHRTDQKPAPNLSRSLQRSMSACIVVETQLPQGPLGLELVSATVNEDGSMYGISVRSAPSRLTSFVRAGTVVTSIDGQDVTGIDFNDAVNLLKHSATRKLTVEHANVDADWEESSVATE